MTRELSSEEEYEALLLQMLGSEGALDSSEIDDILSNSFGADISHRENQEDDLVSSINFKPLFADVMKKESEDSLEEYENLTIVLDLGNTSDDFEVPICKQEEKKSYTRRSVLNIVGEPKDKTQIPVPPGVNVIKVANSNEIIFGNEKGS